MCLRALNLFFLCLQQGENSLIAALDLFYLPGPRVSIVERAATIQETFLECPNIHNQHAHLGI